MNSNTQRRNLFISIGTILAAIGLAYVPIPGVNQTITVVSGSELQEPLKVLETEFERKHSTIDIDLKFQGSQDIVNNYVNDDNSFTPTVLIPANGELLDELSDRWRTQNEGEPFFEAPRAIASTLLVGIAWPERGQVLFPEGRFQWERLEAAMKAGSWDAIGGQESWGSFDFVMTNPTRSNSGQLTLSLWSQSKVGSATLNTANLNAEPVRDLMALVERSVYQPPRSTDILLQEFVVRGPNDADVATAYESIALHRWSQAEQTQGIPYQIYYLNRSVETVSTAAIARRGISNATAKAARTFLDFLSEPEQQAVFVQHGFRPANPKVDLTKVPNSPWNQNIPGIEIDPPGQISPPAPRPILTELIRLWERAG
ncbi:MAG: substrate-binding domain-containing protein [Cyanobacteria bacterium P01_D01_bin.123]